MISSRCLLLLEALSKVAVPTVLVSAKCDNPFKSWEVDQDTVEDFCISLHGVETFQTSASAPETHKRCISVILRNIMLQRRCKLRIFFQPLLLPMQPVIVYAIGGLTCRFADKVKAEKKFLVRYPPSPSDLSVLAP